MATTSCTKPSTGLRQGDERSHRLPETRVFLLEGSKVRHLPALHRLLQQVHLPLEELARRSCIPQLLCQGGFGRDRRCRICQGPIPVPWASPLLILVKREEAGGSEQKNSLTPFLVMRKVDNRGKEK